MKHFFFLLFLFFAVSCNNKKNSDDEDFLKSFEKESKEYQKNVINFDLNATPKDFSARTVNGKTFNSKEYAGKNTVIFIYNVSYLEKSESYNMSQELNEIYSSFKDDAHFIGIVEGFVVNEKDFKRNLKNSNLLFEQIDNTISESKSKELFYNIVCTPAKILIDKKGKVIASSCGGGNSEALVYKLDSIKNANIKLN